jgi:hypothetical protein
MIVMVGVGGLSGLNRAVSLHYFYRFEDTLFYLLVPVKIDK